jgi:hypothetical protein
MEASRRNNQPIDWFFVTNATYRFIHDEIIDFFW